MVMKRRAGLPAALLALAVAAGAIGISVVRAESVPALPPESPDALLASTLRTLSSPPTVAGTVRTHIDLGLPELPELSSGGMGAGGGPAGLLLGDQTFRLWRSPGGLRIAHLARFQEQVLVVNREEAWAWDSRSQQAIRLTQSGVASAIREQNDSRASVHPNLPRTPRSLGDPIGLSRSLLRAVGPYAVASLGTPEVVAGRATYTLELRPRSGRTLVGSIRVAIDAETRLPLRLQVIARGTVDPSIELGFTSVGYGAIDPAIFSFVPPPDARVADATPILRSVVREAAHPAGGVPPEAAGGAMPEVHVFGKGFGVVIAARIAQVPDEMDPLLPYSGPLASIRVLDRGDHSWVVAGPVRPDVLASVESKLP